MLKDDLMECKGRRIVCQRRMKGGYARMERLPVGDQPYLLSVTSTEKLLNYKTHTLTRPLLLVASVISPTHTECEINKKPLNLY